MLNKKLLSILITLSLLLFTVGCDSSEAVFVQTDSSNPVDVTLDEPIDVTLDEPIDVDLADGDEVIVLGEKNGTYEPIILDQTSNSLVIISTGHFEIHEGHMYTVSRNGVIANGASRDTLIVTANTTEWVHLVLSVVTEAEAQYMLYEGTTTSADGDNETCLNRNRNSTNTASTKITYNPTVTDVGTELTIRHWGSGKAIPGEGRESLEWVLKRDTKYLLRLTNLTSSDNYANTVMEWYAHEGY